MLRSRLRVLVLVPGEGVSEDGALWHSVSCICASCIFSDFRYTTMHQGIPPDVPLFADAG